MRACEPGQARHVARRLAQGVTDMVRVSDARMSGTAYGAVVLRLATGARAGGPLAVVQTGDWIEPGADTGRPRRATAAAIASSSAQHVLQADEGRDFDFLVGFRGAEVPRHSH